MRTLLWNDLSVAVEVITSSPKVILLLFYLFVFQNEFVVVDGKAKTKGKERRVFLFEKMIIFSEPMTREGDLPAYRYMHSMKVNVKFSPCWTCVFFGVAELLHKE